MLVTRKEYEQRRTSGYPRSRDDVLFGGLRGVDYQAKVSALTPERAERFLYKFVRHTHVAHSKMDCRQSSTGSRYHTSGDAGNRQTLAAIARTIST